MLVFLRRNLAWMLLAFVLSATLWTTVTTQQNPDVVDVFERIPVELRNVPTGLTPRNEVQAVRLTVAAPRDVWQELRPAKFQAWVDLARVGPGLQEVPIEVQSVDARATIQDFSPLKASVLLEPIRRRTDVSARARLQGELPPGYLNRAPKLTPDQIVVTGPQSLVDQVVAAVADVSLSGVTTSVSQVYRITPQNAAGERVDRVSISPESVLVEIPIEQERAIKAVPVIAQLTGSPAPGYQVAGLHADPTSVILEGEPRVIDATTFVSTVPVDVAGATGDFSRPAELQLPTGTRLGRPQSIVVRVFVASLEGSKVIEVAPSIRNVASGLRPSLGTASVLVTILGPLPVLNSVGPREIGVVLDAAGLSPGLHPIVPQVVVPALVRVQRIEPERVDLRLTLEPTPTPTTMPTPAVTPVGSPTRPPG